MNLINRGRTETHESEDRREIRVLERAAYGSDMSGYTTGRNVTIPRLLYVCIIYQGRLYSRLSLLLSSSHIINILREDAEDMRGGAVQKMIIIIIIILIVIIVIVIVIIIIIIIK